MTAITKRNGRIVLSLGKLLALVIICCASVTGCFVICNMIVHLFNSPKPMGPDHQGPPGLSYEALPERGISIGDTSVHPPKCDPDKEATQRLGKACKEHFGDKWQDECGAKALPGRPIASICGIPKRWGERAWDYASCSRSMIGIKGWEKACESSSHFGKYHYCEIRDGNQCMEKAMRAYLRCDEPLCK